MFRSCPVSLALVGLFVWVTGCSSYKQIQTADVADHSKVRVTLTGGQVSMVEAISANPGGTSLVILGVVVGTIAIIYTVHCMTEESRGFVSVCP